MAKKTNTPTSLGYALAGVRILLGIIFTWAFFDKLFGLGFATPASKAWLDGNSPTNGFLSGVDGPFQGLFNSMAGVAVIDWLFMLGLLGIGLALVFGLGVRIAAITGSLLLFMMWMAALPLKTNPLIDEHLIYIGALIAIACQQTHLVSLYPTVSRLSFFKRNHWLR